MMSWNGSSQRYLAAVILLFLGLFGSIPQSLDRRPTRLRDCYDVFQDLAYKRLAPGRAPILGYADGTQVAIAHAFEKEGLFYSDISQWFDRVDRKGTSKQLLERLNAELKGGVSKQLIAWLNDYPKKYRPKGSDMKPSVWASMDPLSQLKYILNRENPFDVINERGRENLFLDGLLSYDHLRKSEKTPDYLTVGDDLGSYEIRSDGGVADRRRYQQQRDEIEDALDSRIGHQHFVHAWPKDAAKRAEMAPYYIDMIDATTWMLFWRQVNRNPEDVESILTHPFLGVYTKASLARLHDAVVDGDPNKFNNKFRMVGTRNVGPSPELPGQKDHKRLPDLEMRSGNKGIKRTFIEDMIEARIISGDYRGLRDVRTLKFNSSASIEELAKRYLSDRDIETLKAFEKDFPYLKFSSHGNAHNHYRNKFLSPLMAWEERIPLEHKKEALFRAQQRYADGLVLIAKEYLARKDKMRGPPEKSRLREQTVEELEYIAYLFARRMNLDRDFERYLKPVPDKMPSVVIENHGPINPNEIDLGIEYSFRFPDDIRSATAADREIRKTAEAFQAAMGGGKLNELSRAGHGHGLSVRYEYIDPKERKWRVEWDGVGRTYTDGEPHHARGGHVEIPTPKFSPQDTADIEVLYQTMRSMARDPGRHAGGAHVNIDLKPFKDLEPTKGARKLVDFVNYFESNREMVQFLWQHPFRTRAAAPLDISDSLRQKLNAFRGNWEDLGKMLYEERYFNVNIGRKPNYGQLNVTQIMWHHVPEQYRKPIDIKNPEVKWYPSFGDAPKDRIEFRLFDAPSDEVFAALQIKYVRALLNKTLNSEGKILLEKKFTPEEFEAWKLDPARFFKRAEEHLIDLGLDPKEYRPVMADAMRIQQAVPSPKPPLIPYKRFGAARDKKE